MLYELTRRRRALHRIPELKFDLPETKAYLISELKKTGARIEEVLECGLLAFFDAGKDETAAFRTDMDALPIVEATGAEYASLHPGMMHACGHDAHMAMALELADYAGENISTLPRNVLIIFQPAEESGGGANEIVKTGALDRYHISHFFALHLDPDLPEGVLASRPGALMASASELLIGIEGKSAHAAKATEGRDALMAGVELITRLEQMERAMPPDQLRLLKFGSFHSGSAPNIISNRTDIQGSMRSFAPEVFEYMKDSLYAIAGQIERLYGVKIEITLKVGYPAVVNDEVLYARAKGCLGEVLTVLGAPTMLAEDFSFYLALAPGLMMRLGTGTGKPLHSPDFDFDETALVSGARALIRLAGME